jgi:hypothetical protein
VDRRCPSDLVIVRWRAISVPGPSQVIDRRRLGGRSAIRALQRRVECVAVTLRQVQQPDHPGLPFDECADRRELLFYRR